MTNIQEIAKLAGVSVTTVSRVLNNHPYVSDEKQKKVKEIIEQLNYSQNSHAIGLVKGKSFKIGVILPYIDHPYFYTLVSGIIEEAFDSNYSTILCPTNYQPKKELAYLEMLKTKQVDGMIICSHANTWDDIESFAKYGPIVACEQTDFPNIPSVYTDHHEAFSSGMKYLIKKGHHAIGYCVGREDSTSSRIRFATYSNVLQEIGELINNDWIFTNCYHMDDGKKVLANISKLSEKPTALIVNGDEVAAGIIMESKKRGISIPNDLAVIGFDNQPLAEPLDITTIDQNLKEVGRKAFQVFHCNDAPKNICIPFQLIKRGSA